MWSMKNARALQTDGTAKSTGRWWKGTMSGTAVTLMCIRSTEERGDKSCHNKIHYEMGD